MNDPLITIRAIFLLVIITGSLMYVILDYIAFKKEKAYELQRMNDEREA